MKSGNGGNWGAMEMAELLLRAHSRESPGVLSFQLSLGDKRANLVHSDYLETQGKDPLARDWSRLKKNYFSWN